MKINDENLELAYRGFQKVFQDAFAGATSQKDVVAMTVNSLTSEENYAWLGQFPGLREWLGDRVIKQLSSHGFRITNKKFESTVSVKRDDVEDDRVGIYRPIFSEMGRVARVHPDSLIFDLLHNGFTVSCFDGEPFFSAAHPVSGIPRVIDPGTGLPVPVPVTSNMQAGSGSAWYLLDTSRNIKPIIWQERIGYDMESMTDPKTYPVFMRDEFLFGIRARVICGFGLWQLAFGSKADLTPENYAAARAAMMAFKGDQAQLLGVMPTHLVVPPALEAAGRALINGDLADSTSNIWKGSAALVVTPYLQ